MDKIAQYIQKQDKIIREDREKTLIALGLTEKEYSPNNKESWQYPKTEYVAGEKRFYREVAMAVTDEEYALILSKAKQVEQIRLKQEQAKEREQSRQSSRTAKKWVPVFKKPASEWDSPDKKEEVETGRSKIAAIARVVAWILLGTLSVLVGVFSAVGTVNPLLLLLSLGAAAVEMLLFYALASILDYLAELTAIARNGFKYTETNK